MTGSASEPGIQDAHPEPVSGFRIGADAPSGMTAESFFRDLLDRSIGTIIFELQ
jgi:hypothetical protein